MYVETRISNEPGLQYDVNLEMCAIEVCGDWRVEAE